MPSHSKLIASLQDIYANIQLLSSIAPDYIFLDSAVRCHRSVILMKNLDWLATGVKLNSSAIAVTVTADAVYTVPLLESEFYFVDIRSDNGVHRRSARMLKSSKAEKENFVEVHCKISL